MLLIVPSSSASALFDIVKVVALINGPLREAVQDDSVTCNHTDEAGSTRGVQQPTLNVRIIGELHLRTATCRDGSSLVVHGHIELQDAAAT